MVRIDLDDHLQEVGGGRSRVGKVENPGAAAGIRVSKSSRFSSRRNARWTARINSVLSMALPN